MKQPRYLHLSILICLIFFACQAGFSQAAEQVVKGQKTVVYKIHVPGAKQVISKEAGDNIDKMFSGKKGVISSKTDLTSLETRVVMNTNVPEKDLKAIFISQKLEVEKITLANTKD